MPQSLSAVYIHLIFSTKNRRPFLRDKPVRDELHAQLGAISKALGCPPIGVDGVEDHVHLLCRFGRTITQADWVKELKRVSNRWLKAKGRRCDDGEWQGDYANFSVSHQSEQVRRTPQHSRTQPRWGSDALRIRVHRVAPANAGNPGLKDTIPLGLETLSRATRVELHRERPWAEGLQSIPG